MILAETPATVIKTALGGFIFATFLADSIKCSLITPNHFAEQARLDEGGYGIEFRKRFTQDELISDVRNNVLMALGTSAVATDRALDETFGNKNPADTTQFGAARSIIYQIRCAFAHDPLNPRWDTTPKYKRTYTAKVNIIDQTGQATTRTIVFDRPLISGKFLSSSDFGGLSGYIGLLQYCLNEVETHPRGNISYS